MAGFKILATACWAVLPLTGLSACASEKGASDVPSSTSDAPISSPVQPGASTPERTGPTGEPCVADQCATETVVIAAVGADASAAMGTTPLGIDDLPPGSFSVVAAEVSDFGYWLLDAGAGFHVTPSDDELTCIADLKLDVGQTDEAIEGSGRGWERAADCLTAINRSAVDVMRAMDVALADSSDDQYVCVEQLLDQVRTIENLQIAVDRCNVAFYS